jgi:hypothetical protein
MTEVELANDSLIIHVKGADRLWTLRSSLTIPLEHVKGVSADPAAARGWWHGLRAPGAHLPGVIKAGTFYQDKEKVFWDVHDPEKTIIIDLKDEQYSKLVVEVADPQKAVGDISQALEKK